MLIQCRTELLISHPRILLLLLLIVHLEPSIEHARFDRESARELNILISSWFSKVEREVIARGIFTSVKDLTRKLRRSINAYSANAKPIQWEIFRSDPPHPQ